MTRLRWIGAAALALAMGIPATASAATITVDDDRLDCPSAGYTSVQAAVDAASPGDVVPICPGTYEEGPATVPAGGANAVSIAKMITIRGAGASKVTIKPKPTIASLLGTTTNYRNNFGAVIGVYRSGVRTLVDISGVTVEGGVTTVGSAVKFYNAEGSLTGSVIRNVAPLNAAQQGYGAVIASNLVADRLACASRATRSRVTPRPGSCSTRRSRARARDPGGDDQQQHDHRRRDAGADAAAGRAGHRARLGRDQPPTRSPTTSALATARRPACGSSTSISCRPPARPRPS